MFTPHARGSTSLPSRTRTDSQVYPACAGIDLWAFSYLVTLESLPRMRGDRPFVRARSSPMRKFTPHARGSTCRLPEHTCRAAVYPACAGIDQYATLKTYTSACLPRMRGDRPPHCSYSLGPPRLPRMRGDRPYAEGIVLPPKPFTPHARGSTERWKKS